MKIYIKTIFWFGALTMLTATAGFAQVLPGLQSSFDQYNLNTLQEKLFVHTDKNAYTAGELMWFKIYNVDGINHKPLNFSKVVYIEVLDDKQNSVIQAKIAMKEGTGSGSLYIPVTLTTGNFVLRAYTNWMKNFSPDYYFHEKLVIINPLRSPEPQSKVSIPAVYDIQFCPEGGNLVNGIRSVIGVKATDQYGKGIDFTGAVLNKNNDTVVRFRSLKFGMGNFQFNPANAYAYRAVIKIAGKNIEKQVPPVNESGYVMSLKNDGTERIIITVNTNLPAENVYLFAHTRGKVKNIQIAAVSNGVAQFSIDKVQLGEGISQLTIFNSNRQAVCERLYFNKPTKKLVIDAGADQPEYNTRKKVTITLGAKDENNSPIVADLSLSVYKLDSLQHPSSEDIQSYLLLTSDLKGNIESPGYYFTGPDADEAANNLMLTQGWRRFNWADVFENKTPAFNFLPEFNGPLITGHLVNRLNNKPVKDIIAYLAIPGKRVQMYASASDSSGRLLFNMKNFYGPGEIVVQTNQLIDSNYHIDILNPFSEQYADIKLPHLTLQPGLQTTIEEKNLDIQVQNIYNGAKLRQFYRPDEDSSAFYGTPHKTYLLDNYTRFTTMEEVMREYVSEVNIVQTRGHFRIKVLSDKSFLGEQNPMILIDGVPFFDVDKLFALDPLKVYKLDDVPYNYYWGPSFEPGIFSYTTYKGDFGGTEIDPHAVVMDYEGLEVQRQFYSPVYETGAAFTSPVPDFRNELYWAPYISTTTSIKNTFSFYTSDKTGQYIGVIQGLTADGIAGSSSFTFSVLK